MSLSGHTSARSLFPAKPLPKRWRASASASKSSSVMHARRDRLGPVLCFLLGPRRGLHRRRGRGAAAAIRSSRRNAARCRSSSSSANLRGRPRSLVLRAHLLSEGRHVSGCHGRGGTARIEGGRRERERPGRRRERERPGRGGGRRELERPGRGRCVQVLREHRDRLLESQGEVSGEVSLPSDVVRELRAPSRA